MSSTYQQWEDNSVLCLYVVFWDGGVGGVVVGGVGWGGGGGGGGGVSGGAWISTAGKGVVHVLAI